MKKLDKIPESVLACVWFANPDELDWEKSKAIVITSILNRGTLEAVQWAYRIYGEKDFQEVVLHPQRGQWFPQALQFWLKFFGCSLDPKIYRLAIFHLGPRP